MKLYSLKNKKSSWGDYGDILNYGLIYEESKKYFIERTGPYSPLIYLNNEELIFTDISKKLYKTSKLKGLKIDTKIHKKKIINLNWEKWNSDIHISNYIEDLGEPENIILNGENDKELMKKNAGLLVSGTSSKNLYKSRL